MLVQNSWKHHKASVCFSIKQLHDLRMWLACLFGEALACLVRIVMQKGALLCTPCIHEQFEQIAVFHLKITVETSQDAQIRFSTWVFHPEKYHGSWKSFRLTGDARR